MKGLLIFALLWNIFFTAFDIVNAFNSAAEGRPGMVAFYVVAGAIQFAIFLWSVGLYEDWEED